MIRLMKGFYLLGKGLDRLTLKPSNSLNIKALRISLRLL